jgi:hypothetical protein
VSTQVILNENPPKISKINFNSRALSLSEQRKKCLTALALARMFFTQIYFYLTFKTNKWHLMVALNQNVEIPLYQKKT